MRSGARGVRAPSQSGAPRSSVPRRQSSTGNSEAESGEWSTRAVRGAPARRASQRQVRTSQTQSPNTGRRRSTKRVHGRLTLAQLVQLHCALCELQKLGIKKIDAIDKRCAAARGKEKTCFKILKNFGTTACDIGQELESVAVREKELRSATLKNEGEDHSKLMAHCKELFKTDDLMSLGVGDYHILTEVASRGAYTHLLHAANEEATQGLVSAGTPPPAYPSDTHGSRLAFHKGRSMVVISAAEDFVTCYVHESIGHTPPPSLLRYVCDVASFMFRRTLVIPPELSTTTVAERLISSNDFRRNGIDVVVLNTSSADPAAVRLCRQIQNLKIGADFVLNFNNPTAPLLCYPHAMHLQAVSEDDLQRIAQTATLVDDKTMLSLRSEAAKGRKVRLANNPVAPIPSQCQLSVTTSHAMCKEILHAEDKATKIHEVLDSGSYEGVAQAVSMLGDAEVGELAEGILKRLVRDLASRTVPQLQRTYALSLLTFFLGRVSSPKQANPSAVGVSELAVYDAVGCRYNLKHHECAVGEQHHYDLSKMRLVKVATTVSNVIELCHALGCSAPIIIEGGTGLGKTATVEDACLVLGKKYVRFNLSASVAVEDIVGRVQLDMASSGLTPYTDAYKNGHVLVLDECNLAQEEVLSLIEGSLDTGELVTNFQYFVRHRDFRLVVTQNPTAGMFSGKREQLSDAFISRFRRIHLKPLQHEDLEMIVQELLRVSANDSEGKALSKTVARLHVDVSQAMYEEDNPLSVVTMRDLKFVCQSRTGLLYRAYVVYCCRILSPALKQRCVRLVETHLADGRRSADSLPVVKGYPGVGMCAKGDCIVTNRVSDLWKCLDVAVGCGRPVLVVGAAGCGKSCAVKSFGLHMAGRLGGTTIVEAHLTEDTDVGSLIGQYIPQKEGDGIVQWVNGPVVNAMQTGSVLVLDDLLSAPPVVIERLNSVLEAEPELLVSENYTDTRIKAGRGFQVLATGDIDAVRSMSPALANRFVVVVIQAVRSEDLADEISVLVEGSGFKGGDIDQVSKMCQILCKDQPDIRAVTRVLRKADDVDAFKTAILSMHSSESWFGTAGPVSGISPSLAAPSRSVLWCLQAHIHVLLIDERTEFNIPTLLDGAQHDSVLCTGLSLVSEWWGVSLPKSKGVMTVHGPLHTAYTEGHTLILNDFHDLPHCQMAELASLLDRCTYQGAECHEKFAVLAACTLDGLRTIPDRWRKMFHEIVLPSPSAADYKSHLAGSSAADVIAEKATSLRDVAPFKMDLHLFNKVLRRVRVFLGGKFTIDNWALALASLFASYPNISGILQSEGLMAEEALMKMEVPAAITREAASISFAGFGLSSRVTVHSEGDDSLFALFVSSLSQQVVAAVVVMAHAVHAGETIVLAGPSGYKTFATEAYFSIVEGEYEVAHLTCTTDRHDLLGRLCPFNRQDFEEYVTMQLSSMAKHSGEGVGAYCSSLRNMLEETKDALTMFAFKDGTVGRAMKANKGVVYEHANLSSESLARSLTDCLLDRHLPIGLVPTSSKSYLVSRSPQVVIYSCPQKVTHPPGYAQLTVFNCGAYDITETRELLTASLSRGTGEAKAEVIEAMYKLCPKQSLRSALRWVSFINTYPNSSLNLHQVLVTGYEMLFRDDRARQDSVASLGWADADVSDVPSPTDITSMHGYIQSLWNGTNLEQIQPKLRNCVLSRSLCRNLARVLAASTLSIPLLLEGLPGIGKGFVVEQAALLMKADYKRIQMSSGMTVEQLFGCTMPVVKSGKPVFEFREGVLSGILKSATPTWVLLDELNLAPHEVQQALIPVLAAKDPRVRYFSAVNPVEVGGGRTHIPAALKEHFATITLADIDREEVLAIGRSKLEGIHLPEAHVKRILDAYEAVRAAVAEREIGEGTEMFNIRTLEKVALLLAAVTGTGDGLRLDPVKDSTVFNRYILRVLNVVFACGFSSKSDKAKVAEIIKDTVGLGTNDDDREPHISIKDHIVDFDGVRQERGMASRCAESDFALSAEMKRRLLQLSAASSSSLCVLLEGPTASCKTSLVREYASLCGRNLNIISMAPNVEGSDLIGMWSPYQYSRSGVYTELLVLASHIDNTEVLKALREVVDAPTEETMSALCDAIIQTSDVKREEALRVKNLITSDVKAGICFRFAMSRLLKAVLRGDWVLLDNADWAPQEALERLNSLLEADTSLQLFEISSNERALRKGDGIHRNFRLFMTTNPERKHATRVSQALLNRVVKIHLQCLNPVNFMPRSTKGDRLALSFHKEATTDVQGGTCRSLLRSLSSWRETKDFAVLCDSLVRDHMPSLTDGADEQHKAYNTVLRNIIADLYCRGADDDFDDEAQEEDVEEDEGQGQEAQPPSRKTSLQMDTQPEVLPDASPDVVGGNGSDDDEEHISWGISAMEENGVASGMDSRCSGFLVSHDKEGLLNFGHTLASTWRCKPGGVIEELVGNLVAPEGSDKLAIITSICKHLEAALQGSYPKLTPVHLLVMKIYTMEAPDVDRLMGFQNVPVFLEDKEGWAQYKLQYHGKRNSQVYTEVNRSIRTLSSVPSGVAKVEAQAMFERWVKFMSVLICIGDVMTPITLYRSVKGLKPEVVAKYRELKRKSFEGWAPPTSTSRKEGVDGAFVGSTEDTVRFRIHNASRGVYLKAISAYPDEDEVLLPPFTSLEVQGVALVNGYTTVDLAYTESICWDNAYLRGLILQASKDATDSNRRLQCMSGGTKDEVSLEEVIPEKLVPLEGCTFRQGKVYCTKDPVKMEYAAPLERSSLLPRGKKYLQKFREHIGPSVDQTWCNLTADLAACVKDTVMGLERLLVPNVFTRVQASSHGSALYIPGLIKAITTNFTYNKVFASKTAGGKRSYSVVVAFDTSLSKKGVPHVHYQIVDVLVRALAELSVPCTVLVYSGMRVYIVKTPEDAWDTAAIAAFRIAAAQFVENESSAGWRAACRVALETPAHRGYVFVLSSGTVPWSDPDVTNTVSSAMSSSTEVIGVGTDLAIHTAFPVALSLPSPSSLGTALMKHADGEVEHPSVSDAKTQNIELRYAALTQKVDELRKAVDERVVIVHAPLQQHKKTDYAEWQAMAKPPLMAQKILDAVKVHYGLAKEARLKIGEIMNFPYYDLRLKTAQEAAALVEDLEPSMLAKVGVLLPTVRSWLLSLVPFSSDTEAHADAKLELEGMKEEVYAQRCKVKRHIAQGVVLLDMKGGASSVEQLRISSSVCDGSLLEELSGVHLFPEVQRVAGSYYMGTGPSVEQVDHALLLEILRSINKLREKEMCGFRPSHLRKTPSGVRHVCYEYDALERGVLPADTAPELQMKPAANKKKRQKNQTVDGIACDLWDLGQWLHSVSWSGDKGESQALIDVLCAIDPVVRVQGALHMQTLQGDGPEGPKSKSMFSKAQAEAKQAGEQYSKAAQPSKKAKKKKV